MVEFLTTWTCTIPYAPESKANSRQIFRKGTAGRQFIAKSEKAQTFVNVAAMLFKVQGQPSGFRFEPDDKLRLSWSVGYPNYKRDFVASIELLADALQASGIIRNDRQIRALGPSEAIDDLVEPFIQVKLEAVGKLPWKPKGE